MTVEVMTFEEKHASPEMFKDNTRWHLDKFFVVARSYAGARHYSEDIYYHDDAVDMFYTYLDMMEYLGTGGQVCLYMVSNGEFDIIKSDWVSC